MTCDTCQGTEEIACEKAGTDGTGFRWDYMPCPDCTGERHVYQPLHSFPNSVGIGFGPCQYPGCEAEKNSVVHGALGLGITRNEGT